jgi:uncharacterized protein with von Willebrand factor type A (vWA) domain
MVDMAPHLVGFAAALRDAGLSVPTGSVITCTEAIGRLGTDVLDHVYWASRATLVNRHEDIAVFDRVFDSYWREVESPAEAAESTQGPALLALDDEGTSGGPSIWGRSEDETLVVRYSPAESLRRRDFSDLTPSEWGEVRRLISALRTTAELRPSRRTGPSRGNRRAHPDLRATMKRNLRTGGVPVERVWKTRTSRPRRLVLLLDVSGSMEPYARALTCFAHAAVRSRDVGQVEVFAFGTRLTRITRELGRRDPDAALAVVARAVPDWSGGTRIGESIREFNDRWGVRGMARGAVVAVCSDGWDRGDPEVVGAEMARLARVARRIIWVNPLKASPGYAPLARGMAAALPFVDEFVEGHAVDSLEHLRSVIAGT